MPASKAQRVKTAERRTKAVQLRIAGADWDTIARTCAYASRGAACTDVSRALEVATAEMTRDVDVLRHLELTRLDRMQAAFWPAMLLGDEAAARVVMGCIDRRCKLLGLNAPAEVKVLTLGAIETEIARMEEEMIVAAAGEPVPLE
jgi:hypothetical protein